MERKDVVKKVLFGNQKQANVINDAVAFIIAESLPASFSVNGTVEDAVESISSWINTCIKYGVDNDAERDYLKLVVGVAGAEMISNREPCQLYVEQPNVESPKRTFRVCAPDTTISVEEKNAEAAYSYVGELDEKQYETILQSVAARNQLSTMSHTENFMERAERIKNAIIPLISDGVKQEIPNNEWAQALCCAEYYYKFESENPVTPVVPVAAKPVSVTSKPTPEEMHSIAEAWTNGTSLGDICTMTGRPMDQVKFILRSVGHQIQ